MDDLKSILFYGLILVGLVLISQQLIQPLGTEFGQLPTATPTIVVRSVSTATATPVYQAACPTTPLGSSFGYLPDAPLTSTLAALGTPGERLVISGTVYAGDCITPLPGVMVEVWHNDAYGYGLGEGTVFRGRVQTDEAGRYAFSTIKPGDGGTSPAHIHYHIAYLETARPVSTRIFFDKMPVSQDEFGNTGPIVDPRLVVPLTRTAILTTPVLLGVFDIVLPVPPDGVEIE